MVKRLINTIEFELDLHWIHIELEYIWSLAKLQRSQSISVMSSANGAKPANRSYKKSALQQRPALLFYRASWWWKSPEVKHDDSDGGSSVVRGVRWCDGFTVSNSRGKKLHFLNGLYQTVLLTPPFLRSHSRDWMQHAKLQSRSADMTPSTFQEALALFICFLDSWGHLYIFKFW